jgi:hypothetical protein
MPAQRMNTDGNMGHSVSDIREGTMQAYSTDIVARRQIQAFSFKHAITSPTKFVIWAYFKMFSL